MGRLKAIQPRLKPIGSRLQPAVGLTRVEAETQRTRQRDRQDPSRKLYNSRAWRRIRDEVYARDAYTCQKTGILCLGKHPAPNSPVADHIIPHHGDPVLFWDKANLQTVSKAYHDSQKQREGASSPMVSGIDLAKSCIEQLVRKLLDDDVNVREINTALMLVTHQRWIDEVGEDMLHHVLKCEINQIEEGAYREDYVAPEARMLEEEARRPNLIVIDGGGAG